MADFSQESEDYYPDPFPSDSASREKRSAPAGLSPPDALASNQTNDTSTETDMSMYYDTIAFEYAIGIAIPTIYSIIVLIGLVGNILVITVVVLNRHMRNSTNVLIVNLALADLLFLIFCVPFTAADYALPVWVFSYGWCQGLQYLQYVSAYASVWTLVLMAIDRFLAVCLPVRSLTLRTVKNTLAISVAMWVLILVSNVHVISMYGVFTYIFVMEHRTTCTFVAQVNRTASQLQVRIHHLSFVTWGYVVPLSITCVLYYFMLRRLWFGMPARLGSRASEESVRAKKKVTWMVSSVIGTFAVCWLPLNMCFAVSSLTYRPKQPHVENASTSENATADILVTANETFLIIQFGSQILAYANSCLNPILYAFLSENFRKGFYKICGFILGCGQSKLVFDRTTEFRGTAGSRLSAGDGTQGDGCSGVYPSRSSIGRPLQASQKLRTSQAVKQEKAVDKPRGMASWRNFFRRYSSPNSAMHDGNRDPLLTQTATTLNGEILLKSASPEHTYGQQNGRTHCNRHSSPAHLRNQYSVEQDKAKNANGGSIEMDDMNEEQL